MNIDDMPMILKHQMLHLIEDRNVLNRMLQITKNTDTNGRDRFQSLVG